MMLANGLRGSYPMREAAEIVGVLHATGRAVHPAQWVDELIAERQAAAWTMFGPA
jgi:hypothetical protein